MDKTKEFYSNNLGTLKTRSIIFKVLICQGSQGKFTKALWIKPWPFLSCSYLADANTTVIIMLSTMKNITIWIKSARNLQQQRWSTEGRTKAKQDMRFKNLKSFSISPEKWIRETKVICFIYIRCTFERVLPLEG